MKKFILFFIGLSFLYSCDEILVTKEIDYSTIYGGDKVVVHGFITIDSTKVQIKKSLPPNAVKADDKLKIVNAHIKEEETGKTTRLTRKSAYLFVLDTAELKPKMGNHYTLFVKADDLPEIKSSPQEIFEPIAIDKVKLVSRKGKHDFLVYFNNSNNPEKSVYASLYFVGKPDPVRWDLFDYGGLVDKLNPGKNFVTLPITEILKKGTIVYVDLHTLSNDWKKFLKSVSFYEASKQDYFYEQVYPIYSNIENGYGIFASFASSYYGIKFR